MKELWIILITIYAVIGIRYFLYIYKRVTRKLYKKTTSQKVVQITLLILLPVFWIVFYIYKKIMGIRRDRYRRREYDNKKKRYVVR